MRASLLSKIDILRRIERADCAAHLWACQEALLALAQRCDLLSQSIQNHQQFIDQQSASVGALLCSQTALQTRAQLGLLDAMSSHVNALRAQFKALSAQKDRAEAEVVAAYRALCLLIDRLKALHDALARARVKASRRRLQRALEHLSALATTTTEASPLP